MKRTLLALAVLSTLPSLASAQVVRLYGTLDLNAQAVQNTGTDRRLSMGQDGLNQSQLVFAGREDLGDALYAGFVLNAGFNADTGTMVAAKFFNRAAYVYLGNRLGEIRMGRDYVPAFFTYTKYDAFGATGPGAGVNTAQISVSALGQANALVGPTPYGQTAQRADNGISYYLPSGLGGIYGQFMVAAGEGGNLLGATGQQVSSTASGITCRAVPATATCTVAVNSNPGRFMGGRLGYAAGPVDVAVAYQSQRFDGLAGTPSLKTANVGGKYDFGIFRLLGYWDHQSITLANGTELVENRPSISAVVPVGLAEVHVGYSHSKATNSKLNASNVISNTGLGLVYNLSARTALYTTYAHLDNGSLSNSSLVVGSAQAASPTLGGTSSAFQLGVRHFF